MGHEEIIELVVMAYRSGRYQFTAADILSDTRKAYIVEARQVCMLLIRKSGYTHTATARCLRRSCHDSCIRGIESITQKIKNGKSLAVFVEEMKRKVGL